MYNNLHKKKHEEAKPKTAENYSALPKAINHLRTVIVSNNNPELSYIIEWCKQRSIAVPVAIMRNSRFPFAVSVHGELAGWTEQFNRDLYYMPFEEFVTKSRAMMAFKSYMIRRHD